MKDTARRAAIATLAGGSIIVLALALWKLRLVLGLLFFAFILAAAIRPSDRVARPPPRSPGGRARPPLPRLDRRGRTHALVRRARRAAPGRPRAEPERQGADRARRQQLDGDQARRARGVAEAPEEPAERKLVKPIAQVGVTAFEVIIGIFFTLAAAAYWIFERDKTIDLVTSMFARPKRKLIRDTWDLIDAKLGAFVRGQVLLILLVGDRAVAAVLGDRRAVLAARRRVRRPRRDRARDRAADGGRARGGGRLHRLGPRRRARGRLRARRSPARGLPRHAQDPRRSCRALTATRARIGDQRSGSSSAAGRCCSPCRSRRSSSRSSTSCSATSIRRRKRCPR